MNVRNAKRLRVGDYVLLKHNLGRGTITQVKWEWDDTMPRTLKEGRYPMVEFEEEKAGVRMWSTYRIIQIHRPIIRSVI